jgi:hypothetical protein
MVKVLIMSSKNFVLSNAVEKMSSSSMVGSMKPRSPYYWSDDSLYLFRRAGSFYIKLSNKDVFSTLKILCEKVSGYQKYLQFYPRILCAPLDDLYVFRRASCTLNSELLQDLLFSWGWREANWGAWLAALAPSVHYIEYLENAKSMYPHGTIVQALALSSCGAEPASDEAVEHLQFLTKIRDWLDCLPWCSSPLRLAPSLEMQDAIKSEVEAARSAYQAGGVVAARSVMEQGSLGYYLRDHVAWAAMERAGCNDE